MRHTATAVYTDCVHRDDALMAEDMYGYTSNDWFRKERAQVLTDAKAFMHSEWLHSSIIRVYVCGPKWQLCFNLHQRLIAAMENASSRFCQLPNVHFV